MMNVSADIAPACPELKSVVLACPMPRGARGMPMKVWICAMLEDPMIRHCRLLERWWQRGLMWIILIQWRHRNLYLNWRLGARYRLLDYLLLNWRMVSWVWRMIRLPFGNRCTARMLYPRKSLVCVSVDKI